MRASRSLLEVVQGLLERTYRIEPRGLDVERFVIGDRGYRLLYGGSAGAARDSLRVGAGREGLWAAKTLLREASGRLHVCVYYPDGLVRCLEEHPPQRGVRDANVDAFAILVEELDHLLVVAERAAQGRPVTLLELELHADVSKQLVLSRFLGAHGRVLSPRERTWLRFHLFEKHEFCDEDPAVRARYREAARYAVRFIDRLARMDAASERLELLRRFHAAACPEKIRLIGATA